MVGLLFCGAAHAGLSVGGGTEYMEWREYDSNNDKLLTESGMRVFAKAQFSHQVASGVGLAYSGKIYSGVVDYDGQYQDGTPATSETDYNGVSAEVRTLLSPHSRRGLASESRTAVAIGVGVDAWSRNIKGPGGYEEEYLLPYLRLGLEQEPADSSGRWSSRLGILHPFNVQERVRLFDGVDLKPKGKPSLYLFVGYRLNPRWELEFGYEGYRLRESDVSDRPVTLNGEPVDINGDGYVPDYVLQPESDLDTFSFAARYRF